MDNQSYRECFRLIDPISQIIIGSENADYNLIYYNYSIEMRVCMLSRQCEFRDSLGE
ncbi:MAG: hypothetical protein ACI8ZM_003674 [Crocinitomix sp.]|jgi:hypothetical protein